MSPAPSAERVPALFGLGYFLLSGLAFLLAPPLPPPDGDPAVIAAFHAINKAALQANATMTTFAALCLLVFLGGMRGRLAANRTWSAAGSAAGVAGATLVVAFSAVGAAIGVRAGSAQGVEVAGALHDITYIGQTLAGGAFGIAAFAFAFAIRQTGGLPRGLVGAGFATACLLLAGVASVGTSGGPVKLGSPLSLLGSAAWTFWVAAAAAALWIVPAPLPARPLPPPGASG